MGIFYSGSLISDRAVQIKWGNGGHRSGTVHGGAMAGELGSSPEFTRTALEATGEQTESMGMESSVQRTHRSSFWDPRRSGDDARCSAVDGYGGPRAAAVAQQLGEAAAD